LVFRPFRQLVKKLLSFLFQCPFSYIIGPVARNPKQKFPTRQSDDQKFVRIEDATKENKIWGFDEDSHCLPLCATNSLGGNLHQVGVSKIQATSSARAQECQPETNIASTSEISPSEELVNRMSHFRIDE